MDADKKIVIGVVGPCAAGKSTLISGLARRGISARQIAQEHSYVQDMWKRVTNPDILIYLDASFSTTLIRKNLNWVESDYKEQLRRLNHARTHANIIIDTDNYSPDEVLQFVINFLQSE